MHDCNGRRLFRGDIVRVKDWTGHYVVGQITAANAQSQNCNITLAVAIAGGACTTSHTAKECELIVTRDGELPDTRLIEDSMNSPLGQAVLNSKDGDVIAIPPGAQSKIADQAFIPLTFELDQNGMPAAVSTEYAARCYLLEEITAKHWRSKEQCFSFCGGCWYAGSPPEGLKVAFWAKVEITDESARIVEFNRLG